MISFSDLHDATLIDIRFEWEAAVVVLTLKVGESAIDTAVVEANGVTDLKCPHLMPWGRSKSVNSTSLKKEGDGQLLAIEMQSGDTLEIFCREVKIKGY
ncbi:MAG: hypothetical protein WBN92_03715 [Terriglobia bacterium]